MDPSSHPHLAERRKHPRIDLLVPAQLFRGQDVIRVTTRNISIGGFYVLCAERFECGEQFRSLVEVARAHLSCSVRVVRVEAAPVEDIDGAEKRFGVAFAIEDYHVASGPDGKFRA